jgi:hypothetical protein
MTDHAPRLYAVALSLVVFFLAWAVVAAHPWTARPADPRVAALAAREQRLHARSIAVRKLVDRRWIAYRRALAARQKAIAQRKLAAVQAQAAAVRAQAAAVPAAPRVRVVTLPPLTITRTS